jgi:hypothetical protein
LHCRVGGYGQPLAGGLSSGNGGVGDLFIADREHGCAFWEFETTVDQIGDDHSAGNFRSEYGHRQQVLFAFDERLGNAVNRVAARHRAVDLGNDKGGHVDRGIALAIGDQGTGYLLGGHQTHVRDEVAVNGVGQIGIEHNAGEVGAVVEQQVEMADISAVVEQGDEVKILFVGTVDLKAVDLAVKRGADELGPLALGRVAIGSVGSEREQVLTAIGTPYSPSWQGRRTMGESAHTWLR